MFFGKFDFLFKFLAKITRRFGKMKRRSVLTKGRFAEINRRFTRGETAF